VKGHKRNMPRDKVGGHLRLYEDYFDRTNPVFLEMLSRRRYQMSRDMLMVILRGVRDYYHTSNACLIPQVR
jgi:hypothetical protein